MLTIPLIPTPAPSAAGVSALLDLYHVASHSIACVNWPDVAPYAPEVTFRIAHTRTAILLEYTVAESHIRALAPADNGPVWQDSCVEMFITFQPECYYNFESNCAGTILCGGGKERQGRTRAGDDILSKVMRHSTLGHNRFDTADAPTTWTLALVIPVETFFFDHITDLSGLTARANFYKCGDLLPQPHYLSHAPISHPKPNFHLPAHFVPVHFAKE